MHAEPKLRAAALRYALWAGWTVLGFAACQRVAGLEPNLVEEGLMLHVGQRLANGEHLYRDIVFFTGPLGFELLGLLFRLFGEEIAVARAAMAVLHGLATGALWSFARRAGAGALAFAAAGIFAAAPLLLFPLLSIYYYTPLALCLAVLAVNAAQRGGKQPAWAFTAGVLVAAVALCKQTLGATLALTLVPAAVAAAPSGRRLHAAAALALGGAALTALTLAFYGLRGDLPELWRCLVTVPLGLSENYRAPFINLWPPGELGEEILPHTPIYFSNLYFLRHGMFGGLGFGIVLATQLLYALPLAALALTLALRLAGPLHSALWLHGALLAAMTANLFPRSDWGHLVLALPPAFVQLVLLGALVRGGAQRHPRAATLLAGLALAGLAWSSLVTARGVQGAAGKETWGPRVPLQPVSAVYQMPSVPRVIGFLRERIEPGEPIFVARAEPLLYFATDATNPTPFTGVLTALNEEQEEAILAALPRVRFVVMSDTDQPLWTYYSEELPRVWEHLERYYEVSPYFPLDDASWIVVLERVGDRGPTLVDLVDERMGASPWLRDERDGAPQRDEMPPPKLAARLNRRPLPMRLGQWGGGIDYEIEVPAGGHFEAGIGRRGMVSLDDLHQHPKRSRMVLSVGRGDDFEEVLNQPVDDRREAGKDWTPMQADLSKWAGQRVTLRLELRANGPVGRSTLAWWGSPRIAGAAPR